MSDITNKIFGIGLPRTGTTSVAVTMMDLGYRTAHVCHNPEIYEHGDCFIDSPVYIEYPELDKRYPSSKFIYTYRDAQAWERSFREKLLPWFMNLIYLDPEEFGVLEKSVWRCYTTTFGRPDILTPERLIAQFHEHRRQAEAYFKHRKDDVLWLNIDESRTSYQKLCQFLGKPTDPEKRLPKVNINGAQHWETVRHPNRLSSWLLPGQSFADLAL